MSKRIATKKDDRTKDGHYLEVSPYGGGNGYDKTGDHYTISPGNADIMDKINCEQFALDEYVATLNRFCVERYKEIQKRKQEWWKERIAGMELPASETWMYDSARRCVMPKKEEVRA